MPKPGALSLGAGPSMLICAMSTPLRNSRHEAFALQIANGQKLERAHELAGFKPNRKTAWSLRHSPDVARRVEELLQVRVAADTRCFVRRQKKFDDLQLLAIEELKKIAFADVREVAQWDRRPVFSPDGEVVSIVEDVRAVPSAQLSPVAAASIKSVFNKGGAVRVELHDKQAALLAILKLTGAFKDDNAPPSSVTVNQVNVGGLSAIEAARRVAFLIRSAVAIQPAGPQLIGEQSALGEAPAQSDKN
jgi:phage terminase small subunit